HAAQAAEQHHDLTQAEALYQALADRRGEDQNALLALARFYDTHGMDEKADTAYARAVAAAGRDAPALTRYAAFLERKNHRDRIISMCRAYLERFPDDARANQHYGLALFRQGDYEGCIAPLRKAAANPSRALDALSFLGEAYQNLNKLADAITTWEEVSGLSDALDAKQVLYDMGMAHRTMGQPAKAIEVLEQHLQLFPRSLWTLQALQDLYAGRGSQANAARMQALREKLTPPMPVDRPLDVGSRVLGLDEPPKFAEPGASISINVYILFTGSPRGRVLPEIRFRALNAEAGTDTPLAASPSLLGPGPCFRGDVLIESFAMTLPPDLAPGRYTIAIAATPGARWGRKRRMRIFAAILADAVLVVYAYAGCTAMRVAFGASPEMLDTLARSLLPFVAIHIACLAAFESYNFGKTRSESDLAFSASLGVLFATFASFVLATGAILYYAPDTQVIGRSVFVASLFIELALLPGWRVWYTGDRRKRGALRCRVVAIGRPGNIGDIARELQEYSRVGHEVVGCVSSEATPPPPEFLGCIDELDGIVDRHGVGEILIVGEVFARRSEYLLRIVRVCEQKNIVVHIVPTFYHAMISRLDLYEIGGLPLIQLKPHPLSRPYAFVKRGTDIACALTGLALAAPILLAAAIAIRLESPGPIVYRQTRAGKGGREFEILKLRTMRDDAEKETGPVWASKDDPRITRTGAFMRARHIDEIPQLWNILKGDMSLVGPRPERPHFIEQFSAQLPLFPLRLRVRPGITALSHVWGRYDSTPADRLRYDLAYIANVSFRLDLRILIDTVKIVLTGRGAQ
ncbi:MAG: exopolysaccharide biosynthesis polyprenyl glycosylphosphotransferase, partial [Candidatus Hydrogenedentes bacterium]|nr:exopolysaccharide biosynthesis polyprenyl glycosylphosphotransferase [Candidatus Hydrogenedentota bacterium]